MNSDSKFYDINQFPHEEGIVVFGISMSKISNAQKAERYIEYLADFINNKIVKTEGIGAVILYSDYLYMHTDQGSPQDLRARYVESMLQHKNSFLKAINKQPETIPKAYSFQTWGQLLLNSSKFTHYFAELKRIYEQDPLFQKCVAADAEERELSKGQINFFLEEILVFYLISKGELKMDNDYIQHREKWILNCYPGKPLLSEIYLYQQNPFKLKNSANTYEDSYYDLEEKLLYKFSQIDINNFKPN